jgi:protocatechuate 3,4-dioxygenase beta subunit
MALLASFAPIGCGARAAARRDLYQCEEGYCDTVFERDPAQLSWRTTIASDGEAGERMIARGVVYQADGATPASGVVVYAHHTNAAGLYANGTGETAWGRGHGRLRGWVRTGADGRYEFATIKPAPYPNDRIPAHVHLIVLEAGHRPYWIDDTVFEGEFGVDDAYRRARENRGGSGIVRLRREQGVWIAERDIVLEIHP